MSIRRVAAEGFAGSRCRAGVYAERMSIDDRGPAERSELMAVVVLDSTVARFGRRSLWDAPSGVTVRLSHVARSLSAMTSLLAVIKSMGNRSTVR